MKKIWQITVLTSERDISTLQNHLYGADESFCPDSSSDVVLQVFASESQNPLTLSCVNFLWTRMRQVSFTTLHLFFHGNEAWKLFFLIVTLISNYIKQYYEK